MSCGSQTSSISTARTITSSSTSVRWKGSRRRRQASMLSSTAQYRDEIGGWHSM